MASSAFPEPSAARRRELSRAVRDGFAPLGVYAIRNLVTGQVRVASSRNVPGAINRLRFELRMKGHRTDPALQWAWNERGEAGLAVEVLEMLKERQDPAFDYAAELEATRALWAAELGAQVQP